jgi:hypothetical protein
MKLVTIRFQEIKFYGGSIHLTFTLRIKGDGFNAMWEQKLNCLAASTPASPGILISNALPGKWTRSGPISVSLTEKHDSCEAENHNQEV